MLENIFENYKNLPQLLYKMKFRKIFETFSVQGNAHVDAQWSDMLTEHSPSYPSRTQSGQALYKC
jgi:hypothetical protein